ncbi:MAG: hypothetical protein SPI71_07700, partial [Acidaminococcaceae bacterium]|nr:hypothetical protein [Acidaminococcaceae bacterium]
MQISRKKWLRRSITLCLLSGMCCIGVHAYAENSHVITGDSGKDTYYLEKGILQSDGTYKFTEDSTVSADGNDMIPLSASYKLIVPVFAKGKDIKIDAAGHKLQLKATYISDEPNTVNSPKVSLVGLYALDKDIDIKAGELAIKAYSDAAQGFTTEGICVSSGGSINIDGNVSVQAIKAKPGSGGKVYGIYMGKGAKKVIVGGDLNIVGDGTEGDAVYGILAQKTEDGNYGVSGIVLERPGKASELTVKGRTRLAAKGVGVDVASGKVVFEKGATILTPDDVNELSCLAINVGRGGNVVIGSEYLDSNPMDATKTDIQGLVRTKNGNVQIGMGTSDSRFVGVVDKRGDTDQVILGLQANGATWENRKTSKIETFEGSKISKLFAWDVKNEYSVILQKDSDPITIGEYKGNTKIIYDHDKDDPTKIIGGDFIINSVNNFTISNVVLLTDNKGLNTASTKAADKNLVSETLNKLANKIYFKDYENNSKKLIGSVQIAEGLTASSAALKTGDITFKQEGGQGQYLYTPATDPVIPGEQTVDTFSTAITGDENVDQEYVNNGVFKNGVYTFKKEATTITTNGVLIPGGPWMSSITAAISGSTKDKSAVIDLKGNALNVDTYFKATAGISGIGTGKVEISNSGAMSVNGQRAAIYANGGGKVLIHNGGENPETKILMLRAGAAQPQSVAVVKTMNGAGGVTSNITIDGLVDVLADAQAPNGLKANEAVSAVASEINIGGGTIKAVNGAWAAIRAYGEFVSDNYGVVNVNVTKDAEGLANGAGKLKTVLEGDIVTNGGMGTKGRISVGLSTDDSHWIGNYADTRGYGVTPGRLGAVNLFMENGSYWKGFGNGTMNVKMSGAETKWVGFNISEDMQLTLKDGATWHNAITKGQKDQSENVVDSKVKYFTSDKGVIDMTGEKAFIAISKSLSGSPVQGQSSAITEAPNSETGNLLIDNYNGNSTVIYKHEIVEN